MLKPEVLRNNFTLPHRHDHAHKTASVAERRSDRTIGFRYRLALPRSRRMTGQTGTVLDSLRAIAEVDPRMTQMIATPRADECSGSGVG